MRQVLARFQARITAIRLESALRTGFLFAVGIGLIGCLFSEQMIPSVMSAAVFVPWTYLVFGMLTAYRQYPPGHILKKCIGVLMILFCLSMSVLFTPLVLAEGYLLNHDALQRLTGFVIVSLGKQQSQEESSTAGIRHIQEGYAYQGAFQAHGRLEKIGKYGFLESYVINGKEGEWQRAFYHTGKLKAQGRCLQGDRRIGYWEFYSEDGKRVAQSTYVAPGWPVDPDGNVIITE